MALLVLAYPKIGQEDFEWIQSLRIKYDQAHYNILRPHITLVFPFEDVAENELIEHVQAIASKTTPLRFVLRGAALVYNHFEDCWHVFLIPDEGNSRILKLHDRLYTGILADKWLLKVPYIPHITIATMRDCQECKDLTGEVNREGLEIGGMIEAIEIVGFVKGRIESIRRIGLTGDVTECEDGN